jgi:transcriptional regulator with XRE-family HTH domain
VTVDWTPDEIRRRRAARGWSQRELAEALAAAQNGRTVAVRVITDWELGKSAPSARNVDALDRVLGDQSATPGTTLRDATVTELLAELHRRFAALQAEGDRG